MKNSMKTDGQLMEKAHLALGQVSLKCKTLNKLILKMEITDFVNLTSAGCRNQLTVNVFSVSRSKIDRQPFFN